LSPGADVIPPDTVAEAILRKVVSFARNEDRAQLHALDSFPLAIYVTDINGFITYFNPACIDFAGRTPTLNEDRWCVTWKLFTNEGDFLPHERCPMAIAIQTKRAVRGMTAVAERPNGIRIRFQPFPTPVISEDGELLGAVNMLVDIASNSGVASGDDPQTLQSQRVEQVLQTFTLIEVQDLVEEIEIALGRPPRVLN
jgi:PAS domain-containing protein